MNFYRLYDNQIDDLQEEVYLNACKAVQIALHNPHLAVFQYIESKKSRFELEEVLTDVDCKVLSQMPEQVREILGYIDGGPFKWADFDLILIYLADAGYEYDKKYHPYLKEELNAQAKYIKLPDLPEFYMGGQDEVWATDIHVNLETIKEHIKKDLGL